MTFRLYADHKKVPVEAIHGKTQAPKLHAEDCQDCEDPETKIDFIEREIELHGDIDEPTRKRMLKIANRCPVHRTLESKSRIATTLKE